ncbi:hypothetical protein ABDB91_17855 [Desulfoscipio sp. XC116]|uniref:hypothetical protein n=1 Tax=Desulfoscipio sp. XC116 TaxID=3144975 RepID=UPI00325B35EC
MDNDKFQELVLQQFQVMNKQFQAIDQRFETITDELQALKEGQVRMETRIGNLEEGQVRMETRIGNLEKGQTRTETRMDRFEKSQDILATEVMAVKSNTNGIDTKLTKLAVRVENEIEPKINTLLEGHKQNTEQLTRIEAQVRKHEEFILKRIK